MREIKFRAWDKIESVMCPVTTINFEKGAFLVGNSPTPPKKIRDGFGEVVGMQSGVEEGHFCVFGSIELMQYTGLKDKNGKEIYEGDVVREDGSSPREICFGKIGYDGQWNGLTGFYFRDTTEEYTDEEFESVGEYLELGYGFEPEELEVIGNIYENPDLLNL